MKHIPAAIEAVNFAKHSTTGWSPVDLWTAPASVIEEAFKRTAERRNKRNLKRRIQSANFYPGQEVLVYDEVAASTRSGKFVPRWRGPYRLVGRVRGSYWQARKLPRGDAVTVEPGRKPSLVFHEDQLQPFDSPWRWEGRWTDD